MIRKLVLLASLALVLFVALALLAPLAPDGSWLFEAGDTVRWAMRAWWGNPVAP